MRRSGGLTVGIAVTAAALAVPCASTARAETTRNWCSALAYLLGDAHKRDVTVTVSCSSALREIRISIPSARRLHDATARTASHQRPCRIEAGAAVVCDLRLPAEAGIAITAAATPAPRVGRIIVFNATFADGARSRLRLTLTNPPGDDG